MKNLLLTVALMIISISSYAQEKDVTKFLGIPIDGTKAEMIAKLKEKGFTSIDLDKDVLEGEFNGTKVNIYIATNNNKVWRIGVWDQNSTTKNGIKRRFNNLCHQFYNNPKYAPLDSLSYYIPEQEDIEYEISVNDKQYEATFIQKDQYTDSINTTKVSKMMLELAQDTTLTDEIKQNKIKFISDCIIELAESRLNKVVWFKIQKRDAGSYCISLFYDNEQNHANGEDL